MKIYLVVHEPYHDNTTIYGAYTESKMAEHVSLTCFPGSEVIESNLDENHQPFKTIWWATIRLDTGEETEWRDDDGREVNEQDEWFSLPITKVSEFSSVNIKGSETPFKGVQAFSDISYEDALKKARDFRLSVA